MTRKRHAPAPASPTGRGRPEIGPAFTLRFPTGLLAAVDARAAREGVSRAELIRRFVTAGLD